MSTSEQSGVCVGPLRVAGWNAPTKEDVINAINENNFLLDNSNAYIDEYGEDEIPG